MDKKVYRDILNQCLSAIEKWQSSIMNLISSLFIWLKLMAKGSQNCFPNYYAIAVFLCFRDSTNLVSSAAIAGINSRGNTYCHSAHTSGIVLKILFKKGV